MVKKTGPTLNFPTSILPQATQRRVLARTWISMSWYSNKREVYAAKPLCIYKALKLQVIFYIHTINQYLKDTKQTGKAASGA